MNYRKKPVVIQAVQWTGRNQSEILKFCHDLVRENGKRTSDRPVLAFRGRSVVDPQSNVVLIETLEGIMEARAGDWIIRGVKGEFYPCKPEIFEATYDPVP